MLHDVQQHSVVIPVSACVSLGMAGASAHRVGNFEAWGWLAPLFGNKSDQSLLPSLVFMQAWKK